MLMTVHKPMRYLNGAGLVTQLPVRLFLSTSFASASFSSRQDYDYDGDKKMNLLDNLIYSRNLIWSYHFC